MDVNGKVAIVTGGLGGIGFCTVQHLLRNEAKYVAIFDLAETGAEVVYAHLKQLEEEFTKGQFGYYRCNVRNFDEFIDAYKKVLDATKYVDILVNNAAIPTDKEIDLIVDINFKSVVKCTMHAIEHMGKHKGHKGGVVVNIGSFLGLINFPVTPVYNATKHAVVSYVRSMKEHNQVFGVRIVCICPGMTKTDMTTFENLRSSTFDYVPDEPIHEIIKGSIQSPENVASAIVEIIERGKEGDVWLSQNDQPPFNVGEEIDLENMRIPF